MEQYVARLYNFPRHCAILSSIDFLLEWEKQRFLGDFVVCCWDENLQSFRRLWLPSLKKTHCNGIIKFHLLRKTEPAQQRKKIFCLCMCCNVLTYFVVLKLRLVLRKREAAISNSGQGLLQPCDLFGCLHDFKTLRYITLFHCR